MVFSSPFSSSSYETMEKVREKITFRWVILAIEICFFLTALGLVIWYGVGRIPGTNPKMKFKDIDREKYHTNMRPWTAGITCYTLLLFFQILRQIQPLPSIIPAICSFFCSICSILAFWLWSSDVAVLHGIYPLITFTWNMMLTSIYSNAWINKNVSTDWVEVTLLLKDTRHQVKENKRTDHHLDTCCILSHVTITESFGK